MRFSPIAGIIGQRQVGKTTVISRMVDHYVTFDRQSVLSEAMLDAEHFLQSRPRPLAIDEAQLCPTLFPALKEAVRVQPQPGQYLLSGSVRFTSRAAIRESLTGRIVTHELIPFTCAESHGLPLPDRLGELLKVKSEADLIHFAENQALKGPRNQFESHLETGGLPGICFYRDAHIRADKFEAQIDTLLNRDIRLVSKTTLPYESLRALLQHFANVQGRPFELKAAAEASRISIVTLKKIIPAYEALFLIRPVLSSGPEKHPVYFLEDQGMASWLIGKTLNDSYDICRGLFANLRQEIVYRPEQRGKITHFRTKHGVTVPLVFTTARGTVGIIPTTERQPAPKTLGAALAFAKRHAKERVVIATSGTDVLFRSPQIFQMPYWVI